MNELEEDLMKKWNQNIDSWVERHTAHAVVPHLAVAVPRPII
jgi:hypothetical protein